MPKNGVLETEYQSLAFPYLSRITITKSWEDGISQSSQSSSWSLILKVDHYLRIGKNVHHWDHITRITNGVDNVVVYLKTKHQPWITPLSSDIKNTHQIFLIQMPYLPSWLPKFTQFTTWAYLYGYGVHSVQDYQKSASYQYIHMVKHHCKYFKPFLASFRCVSGWTYIWHWKEERRTPWIPLQTYQQSTNTQHLLVFQHCSHDQFIAWNVAPCHYNSKKMMQAHM